MSDSTHSFANQMDLGAGHPDRDLLRAFALGRLPEGDLEPVAEHLATCGACCEWVESSLGDSLTLLVRGVRSSPSRSPLRLQSGYELLESIGQGGMGVVYRARQVDLGRIVALKQIKGAVDSRDLARFRAEAAAMARLQHPNIVQVFDVGEQDEWPYIACEFVSGGNLENWLAGQPIAMGVAARLVATLARAVDAAHQQGVVHRDLKPSNILLEKDRQEIIPKIADFGLAKLLDQDDAFTRTGAVVGTPAYMAPEQAGGRADEIGPQADIYALGVVLYEALTGRRPFQGTTVIETLDLVRSAEPVPPRRWRPALARDLDVICLTCLAKEPQRRYATAAALADDLEAFLAGEPIRARPVPGWERSLKWARRHPARAALVLVCVLAATGLVAGTTWHNQQLRGEVERANRSEREALASFRHGYEALDQLIREVTNTSTETLAWRELNQRIWIQSLDFFDGVLKDADESVPDVRLAKGMLSIGAGGVHVSLGRYEQALVDLGRARERLESLCDARPTDHEARYHLAYCYYWTAVARFGIGEPEEAARLYRKAIELDSELVAAGAAFARLNHRLAQAHEALGWLYVQTARPEAAVEQFEACLAVRRKLFAKDPADNINRLRIGEACGAIARFHFTGARVDRAESYLKEAQTILAPADGAPQSIWIMATLAETQRIWGVVEISRDRTEPALEHLDMALAELDEILLQEPTHDAKELLIAVLALKQAALTRLGRADEAPAAWDAVIEHSTGARRDFFRSQRALTLAGIGDHTSATSEADELMATPNLEGRTLVSLAHVYARALETVERDPPISAEDARQTKLRYAACALACLRRAEIASRAQIRPEVSTSAVRRGESQSSRTASADERGRFAQDCVEVAQRLLAGDCESDAETCLQFAEAIVPPADDSALAIAVKRLRAEFCRRRAQFEIAQGKLDSALERINPGIALLDALRARDPTGAVAGELQVLLRDKAWWLSRAGRTDEAFAAWDRAVSNATGPDRDFCRCERALERALAGDHLAAIAEADELSSMTDLPGHLLVHLARVHARSIEAVDRHSALSSEEGVALKTRFAGRAIACLSRAEADWLTTPGRLDEVDADAAFAALRGSDSFRAWRQAFKQPNAD